MKETELSLETRLYRCGWVILIALGVLKLLQKVLFPQFVLSFGTRPCVFYTLTGYFCPGCGGTRSLRALLSGKLFVCAVDFPMIFYAAVVFAWFMISQTIDRISRHRIPIGMRYRHAWVYASLAIVVIHFVVKNLFYIKTGVEPFL
ncbi:DUF2752 domain-containing protein [uncultured Eubacterium sp.]|uniref:DUF2752 domain-containing protein n=1 Tax=uncultured Eubacterium sp. TaxID=165185 RepID=UPI0025E9061E|nr:DUF2752 domain-containing protein [uncultured Eubacterium sp.]MCI6537925.1 DUF2752 domain-containing protein [Lachnospiraceae bacterium]